MKHVFKSAAMAALLLTAGLSNAANVSIASGTSLTVHDASGSAQLAFTQGSGSLEFSNGTGVVGGTPTTSVGGLVGALNVGRVTLTGIDQAVINQRVVPVGPRRTPTRASIAITAAVSSLSADDQTGRIQSVSSFGGAQQDAGYLDGVLDGGRVTVKNLRFDLINKVVYADLSGQALELDSSLGPLQTSLNTALWTFGSISGPTVLPTAGALLAWQTGNASALQSQGFTVSGSSISASNVLGGLRVTEAGFNFFASSLGLVQGSTGYDTLASVNGQPDGWGSITSTMTFTSSVPEPGAYSLAVAGLVVVTGIARRRQKQFA